MPYLLNELSLEGVKNWIDYGINNYGNNPERQKDYFCLQSADSKTILNRQRHRTLFIHNERKLDLYLKARLAAMEAGDSTRMGAALKHAAHYLGEQTAEKKLSLVLTDSEPSDIDVDDQRLLIEDARKTVQKLDQGGIYTYCINLDVNVKPGEDDYVMDIFGNQYTIIDKIERLPEKLPKLFMALTG